MDRLKGFVTSLGFLVTVALVAGVWAGGALSSLAEGHWLREGAMVLNAIGGLWLNLLRMTVAPLIAALLVTGVASVADAAATGRLALRACGLFLVLLVLAAAYGLAATEIGFALWPIDPEAARALADSVGAGEPFTPPTLAEFIRDLAPSNIFAAASSDAVLPLVVFAIFLGFAATRLPAPQRDLLVGVFRALGEAMIVMVRWVLLAAPLGVFGLALGVGLGGAAGAAGLIAQYVVVVAAVTAGVTLAGYALAFIVGRASPPRFVRATAPVLAIAFSTQSSLASLPAMVERMRDVMGVPARTANLVLPLAVAVFRFTSPVANLGVVVFLCHVHGVEPGLSQYIAGALVAVAVSIASVGLPGQVSFFASVAPIALTMGAPIELLGVLLAVEVIPDIFRTLGNVTGDMAATVILAGKDSDGDETDRPAEAG